MMIDQDLPKSKSPWKDRHFKLAKALVGIDNIRIKAAGIGLAGIIMLIEAGIRIWSALQRARERKKERDKEKETR